MRWCASDVWRRLSVAFIGPKSRTERPRNTKIGGGSHVTRDSDTTFKVKRSKVNLQGAGHIVAASRTACLNVLNINFGPNLLLHTPRTFGIISRVSYRKYVIDNALYKSTFYLLTYLLRGSRREGKRDLLPRCVSLTAGAPCNQVCRRWHGSYLRGYLRDQPPKCSA